MGTGHLVRCLALARAALAEGAEALVISGGRPLAHLASADVPLIQLPPLAIRDGDYRTLRTPEGNVASDRYVAARRDRIASELAAFRPDALVTELFPLGRRPLAAEFQGAIAAARRANPQVVVASSVRDVPEPKPKRLPEVAGRLRSDFHAVLVHGDEAVLPLWRTWPLPEDLRPIVHHCGYVAAGPKPPAVSAPPGRTVLVSTGGGALGRPLLTAAAQAAAQSDRPWRLLVGGGDATAIAADLTTRFAHRTLTVEPARTDFPALLATAAVSISLAGYNTLLDIAATETPAILCPSTDAGDREQTIRARHFARFPGITCLEAEEISADALARQAEAAALGPRRKPLPMAFQDGAGLAIRTLLGLIERRSAA